jgi:uncharacterized membrane-anchored protein YhcB (DUF1043 family)|tara:strand:- start:287 stop:511 length:225 start_codon:yes stop_codon:yes gene_type:complete
MNEWILFTIGLLIGNLVGVVAMSIISVKNTADFHIEIQDLRTQRKLLKEELLKRLSRKPPPRKRRKNVKPVGKD